MRHVANVVRTKKCGERIHPFSAVDHVRRKLGEFNVKLNAQNSNPWWVQGDKAQEIKVHLNSNKPDMLLSTGRHGPVGDWQKDRQISGGGCIVDLRTRIVVKQ